MTSPYESVFESDYFARGLAVGESRVLTDTIYFRFRDEQFEHPAERIYAQCRFMHGFYTMEVEKLRALQGDGHG